MSNRVKSILRPMAAKAAGIDPRALAAHGKSPKGLKYRKAVATQMKAIRSRSKKSTREFLRSLPVGKAAR